MRNLWSRCERIARAAPTLGIADKNTAFDERQNVTEGGVVGTLCELCIFHRRELALEAIKEMVQYKTLALVDRETGDSLPK